ncbi:BTAD domain-containing putative transcriptional regulator [Streptomyces sp. NPDC008086]|uniref:AfsR/SARP family transcriptional regulator n=1 Tax=Streptomyces sp. NPDC008086 TaxID=3364807 RepID=UPI0036F15C64
MKRYELRFGLLGPPVVFEDAPEGASSYDAQDLPVRMISSPKVRALFAALLLEGGRIVSVESLKDVLWGGAPPASAKASLHNHVARLRRLLDDPERLRAVPPGYVLRVDEGELDVDVFVSRVAAARVAHVGRDWERTVRECTRALALWRGAPLAGLPAEVGGYALVQRLAEARLLLMEWRYDAELNIAGPRLDALVPELTALAAEHPLRESFHRHLMLALHHTGRRAEALTVHRALRTRLIEELGVEPGAGVREAHVEVLRGGGGAGREGGEGAEGSADGAARAGGDHALRAATQDPAGHDGGLAPGAFDTAVAPEGDLPEAPANLDATRDDAPLRHPHPAPARHEAPTPAAPAPRDPALPPGEASTSPPAPPRATPTDPPRPAQLPPPPAHFTGRAAVLHDLRRTLTPASTSTPSPASTRTPSPTSAPTPAPARQRPHTAVAVISGMAGVGKSALALEAAHGLANRFPDGQLHVNLHGATPGMPPLTSGQALTALLRDLGTDPRAIPEHPDAAAALLRSLLAPTRTLLVLDDAAHAAQVRPLLPAAPGCAVIVTSRSPLTALDGAHRFPLTPLPAEDSAALLRAASGRGVREGHDTADRATDGTTATTDTTATIDAVHPLVALTGGLPLALRIVAARLAARSALTPDVLARQLAATESRLHHLEYDDLSVRRSLAVAHDALAASDREADRDAARALRRIGALDLPAYGAPLLARLTGTDERRAEAALDRLVDVALLEETAYGRYTPHDLVRDFARELAEADGDFTGTAETALRWYAAVAERTLTAIVEPGLDRDDRRRPTPTQPQDHPASVDTVPPFDSPEAAFAWGDLELENIVALAERHGGTDHDEQDGPTTPGGPTAPLLSTLVRLLFPCLQRSGRVAEMELLGAVALRVARRLGDEAAEAYALGDLAGLHFLTGRQSEALHLNDRALTIWRRLEVVSWTRRCLNNRGLLLEGLGRYAESGEALRQSLAYSRQLNDPHGEAVTYSHLGNLYEHTDPRAAIEQHRRSLAIGDEIGNVIVQHSAHCNIGYAHLTLGEPAAAAEHFGESLRILGGHGDWHGESQTRLGLVRALRLLGRTEPATHACAELLARADARADRYTGGLARHQKGLLLHERGRVQEAYAEWRTALDLLDGTDEKAVVEELRQLLADPATDAARR